MVSTFNGSKPSIFNSIMNLSPLFKLLFKSKSIICSELGFTIVLFAGITILSIVVVLLIPFSSMKLLCNSTLLATSIDEIQ